MDHAISPPESDVPHRTCNGSLSRLCPVAGRLKKLELSKTLSLPADLERFHADHPQTEVVAILPKHFEQTANTGANRFNKNGPNR